MYCRSKQIFIVICLMEQFNFCKLNTKEEFVGVEKSNDNLGFVGGNATLVENQEVKFQKPGNKGNEYRISKLKTVENLKPQTTKMEEKIENFKGGLKKFQQQYDNPETRTISTRGNETEFVRKHKNIFFEKSLVKLEKEKKVIYVLGLFDLTELRSDKKNLSFEKRYRRREEGESEIWAAKLALSHVNKHKLFGGYHLEMFTNDTKCEAGAAIDALFHAIFSAKSHLPILFGSGCSLATAILASVTPYWNIVQISFGVTSPILSNREKFPLFYRVAAPESSHSPAKLAFIRHFGWNTVTFVSQNEKEYILAVNYFINVLETNNITCKGTVTFGKSNFQEQLQLLKELDTRIFFGSFSEEIAPKIFCKVFELGVFGEDYAWILQGTFRKEWWKNQSECSEKTLKLAVQGIFFVTSFDSSARPHSFPINFTRKDLQDELSQLNISISNYARESYDAVWVAAMALNDSLKNWNRTKTSVEDFSYTDKYDLSQEIFKNIGLINLIGMSGPISFDGADRVGVSTFSQLQGEKIVTVAIYYPDDKILNFSCDHCREIFWKGGQVPISQRFLLKRIETISFQAFLWISCSTAIAIIFAIFFLILNSYFSKLKNIKLSSPKLNNIAVAGCIAVYIGVFLLSLDFATLPNINYFPIVCTAKVYFFVAGFSLAFGSIFAKTYRVHKIFIKNQGGFMRKKILQDKQLILLVGILLLIDGFILTIWVVLDPLQRKLHNTTIEFSNSNRSVIYQTQIEICSCSHLSGWLSFLYLYKGLQLLVGVILAWETRRVKVPGLNDSQYILLSVYIVVITCCIVVVLTNLIFERPTIAFLIISTMILSSTTATWCLLFCPNVKIIFSKSDDNIDPIMQSMGLILESNTRRFMMNDAKEKLYRMEVQNKVYKREVFALTNEISCLEKKLLSPPRSHHSRDSSKHKLTKNHQHHRSLPELSAVSEFRKIGFTAKVFTSSWPNDIHKIAQSENLKTLPDNIQVQFLTNSHPKFVCLRNCLRDTLNPPKRKLHLNHIKFFEKGIYWNHKKLSVSNNFFHFQKTKREEKSSENLRECSFWWSEKEEEEIIEFQNNKQFSSKVKFKGSPRFPHRIVPSNVCLPDYVPESSLTLCIKNKDFGDDQQFNTNSK